MNLTVLRYCLYDLIKPVYHLKEDDKFLLTARIDKEEINPNITYASKLRTTLINSHKECGLYFLKVVMNKKSMWQYVYRGYHKKGGAYFEMDFETHMINAKGLA